MQRHPAANAKHARSKTTPEDVSYPIRILQTYNCRQPQKTRADVAYHENPYQAAMRPINASPPSPRCHWHSRYTRLLRSGPGRPALFEFTLTAPSPAVKPPRRATAPSFLQGPLFLARSPPRSPEQHAGQWPAFGRAAVHIPSSGAGRRAGYLRHLPADRGSVNEYT